MFSKSSIGIASSCVTHLPLLHLVPVRTAVQYHKGCWVSCTACCISAIMCAPANAGVVQWVCTIIEDGFEGHTGPGNTAYMTRNLEELVGRRI